MAKLKPWYQVVTPREDLRENRPMDASEFAVHLDHIRSGNAPEDYVKPERLFERTVLTGGLQDLATQTLRRLSGMQVETSAVFNMATQFGGGKSHSLAVLYHLARHGERARSWKGVDTLLSKARVPKVPEAAVAVFMGKEFDSLQGRGGDGEPVRKTPWGEIAWQLGGAESFEVVRRHEAEFIEPKGDVIRRMLPKDRPALILMDEIISYASTYRGKGYGSKLYNFLDVLAETARGEQNVCVVVSVPASELEYTADDAADEARFKKMLDRLGKAIMMSADTEIAEIIRRRLFEWGGLPDDARKTAAAYAEWAVEHVKELSGIDPDTAQETFRACYPFHPSVISVFERKWQSLPRFQRTRGILRLLALWVAHAYQEEHRKAMREPLITLGSAPFEDPVFRSAMFLQLGSDELEVPVTTDIAGRKDAHAVRLDREAPEAIKQASLHRKVASTIFFESNGGMSQAKTEAALTEIRMGVGGPELNLADVDNVLEGLVGTCYYLNWDRNRYRFGLSPNLNQILVTRRGAVQPKEIAQCIKEQTERLFDAGPNRQQIDRKYFPERSNAVPSRPVLTLVVLGLDHPVGEKATEQLMESIVRDCGSSGRTYKSAVLFAVPDSAETTREATRDLLAWEAIDDDTETKERLDEAQKRLLARNLGRARSDLKESIWRAYRCLYLLGKDNKLRQIDLGQITSSMAGSLVELYLNELGRTDEITAGISATKLLKYWPPALAEWSTKGVRDAFYSSPQLPRLLNAEAIKRTIADGVSEGLLGYATRDERGQLKLLRFDESLLDGDVEISEDFYVLKADDARRLLEPPRLAGLVIRPEHAVIAQGEQASFTCNGVDQYGQPYAVGPPKWSATGGSIEDGMYVSEKEGSGGLFAVRAELNGFEAIGEVRVTSAAGGDGRERDESQPGVGVIRWQGDVPPQKWMNFYTKVLSRFAATPGLKLKVSFEVPAERDEGRGKAEEARSGLKELGLSDNVEVR